MHEPDKAPDTKMIIEKHYTVKWIANLSLIFGIVSIGATISAIIQGRWGPLLLSGVGIGVSIVAIYLGRKLPDERARFTGVLGLVLNTILFVLLFILYVFFTELSQAL